MLSESLDDEEAVVLNYLWTFWARDDQLPPTDEDWTTWLILAGRGFGKTRSGAEWVRNLEASGLYGRIGLVAEDAGDARDVMIEGESGILAVCPPWNKPRWNPSKKRLTWDSGAIATLYSAEDPESLRGPQFDAAWLDELAKWQYQQDTYDMLQFGLRLGRRPLQCITTTPRPTKLLKQIMRESGTRITGGSTYENLANLAPTFRDKIISRYEGTRLGRQELYAEVLGDNPDALWHLKDIEADRVKAEESCDRIVVAIDPPITSGEDADECGIIGMGRSGDRSKGHGYVLADASARGLSPEGWAGRAVALYKALSADAIVAEVNQGGDMVESVIRQVDANVPVKKVHATRGKVVRAEPVSAMYEQHRVHHVGMFAELEDQMCDFSTDFDKKKAGYSPDRVDALVWAATELFFTEKKGTAGTW